MHRPDRVTVFERRGPKADPETIDNIVLEHKLVAHRVKQTIDPRSPEGVQPVRDREDGDETGLNAAVDAMVPNRRAE